MTVSLAPSIADDRLVPLWPRDAACPRANIQRNASLCSLSGRGRFLSFARLVRHGWGSTEIGLRTSG